MVINNVMIFDFDNFIENGFVRFDKEIIQVGSMDEYKPTGEEEIDFSGKLLLPGFIVGHAHIYSTFARGMIVPFNPKSFKDILEQLWWKLDSKLDLEAVKYSGLVSAVEYIKNGVTTVIDHHASGTAIRGTLRTLKEAIVDEGKLRGIFCFETSDRFPVNEAIEENVEFMKERSEKHAGMFGLHASLSLSDETLKKVAEVLNGEPIHIHVAESAEDEEDSLKKSGMRVVERLDHFGLLTENSILAHCVHIDEKEAEIISKRKVYIALNVTSNMNNAVGLPKTKLFKEYGIKIIIGNDGLGYNIARDWMNLYFSQKLLYGEPTYFSLQDLKEAIQNTYELASKLLGVKIGKIQKGYKADFTAVEYTPPTPISSENALGHFFFGVLDSPKVTDVLVDGEFLMRNGKIHLDVEGIYDEARRVAENVWRRLD
jgi:putative selenium metabolism protein SsnA